MRRRAIALMVTLFFIMAISVVVGVSLLLVKKGRTVASGYTMLAQSALALEDVLAWIESSAAVKHVSDPVTFGQMIDAMAAVPLEIEGVHVTVRVEGAGGAVNINALSASPDLQERFRQYLARHHVKDTDYLIDLLLDCMEGDKPHYRTTIIDANPQLYRERIAGIGHLEQILAFYSQERYDPAAMQLDWQALVRFDEHNATSVDLNQISAEALGMLLPRSPHAAIEAMLANRLPYESFDALPLDDEAKAQLQDLGGVFYLPHLRISLAISTPTERAEIVFDYDLETRRVRMVTYAI